MMSKIQMMAYPGLAQDAL